MIDGTNGKDACARQESWKKFENHDERSPTRKFAALCGKEKEHPMNRFRPKNVPLAELCFVGNAVLQSAPTQQKRLASPPRPPDPDFAGILRIPAAKSARLRFFQGKISARGRRTHRRPRWEFERFEALSCSPCVFRASETCCTAICCQSVLYMTAKNDQIERAAG